MTLTFTRGSDAAGHSENKKPRRGRTRRGVFVHPSCIDGLLLTRPAGEQITDDDYGIGRSRRRLLHFQF
jgi:hypothetical protein